MAEKSQQTTEAQERRREDVEWRNSVRDQDVAWRNSVREEDVTWRQATRREEVEFRERVRCEESRLATRRAALTAAAQCAAPGTPISAITQLAEQFIAWIGEAKPE